MGQACADGARIEQGLCGALKDRLRRFIRAVWNWTASSMKVLGVEDGAGSGLSRRPVGSAGWTLSCWKFATADKDHGRLWLRRPGSEAIDPFARPGLAIETFP